MKLTPSSFIAGSIGAHEGELSAHPADNGNWYDPARYPSKPQKRGLGVNVGSKYGVTAYALVSYRIRKGVPKATALKVTRADMAALTFETATDIGVELYFNQPGFNKLVWNRVTASIFDKAWGSGPGRAIIMLQQLLGVTADGALGPKTAATYAAWIQKNGEEACAHLWCNKRIAFDTSLTTNDGPNDPDKIYINGWNNRSRSFLPGTKWWKDAG